MSLFFDVVKADPRPTLTIDLEHSARNDLFKKSFYNDALLSCTGLSESLLATNDASNSFKDWIQNDVDSSAILVHSFHGMKWIQFTSIGRFKVVSALSHSTELEKWPLEDPSRQYDLPAFSSKSAKTSAIHSSISVQNEPNLKTDYPPLVSLSAAEPLNSLVIETEEGEASSPTDGWSNKFQGLLRGVMQEGRIAEMAKIGIFEFLPSGKLRQANDNWYEASGYPRDLENATEFSFMDCVFEDDKTLVMQKWDTLANGVPVTFDMRWDKSNKARGTESLDGAEDARMTWICAACVPVLAEDGSLSSISGFTTDMSAQKRTAQHKIDRADAIVRAGVSDQRFAHFAEFAPVGIWILDCEYQITYGNDMYFQILGSPRVEYKDVRWADFVLEEDVAQVLGELKKLTEEKVKMNFEFRLKRPFNGSGGVDGETWIAASLYPDFHENGTIKEILGIVSEVSRYKWAESAQRRRVEEALESKRQQESFIDMTSHEMRNPISAVIQSADLISTSLVEMRSVIEASLGNESINAKGLTIIVESSFEAVKTIIACSLHQKRIVDDILTVSKLDSSLLLITPSKVQPVAVINDTLKMLEAEARVANVSLRYVEDKSLANSGIDWVMMDPSRVLQVFMNLLTTSIKFNRTDARREVTVTIKASREKPNESEGYFPAKIKIDSFSEPSEGGHNDLIYLHFVVQDPGRGLTPEEKAKIFSKFIQASPRTHVEYGGSGLGLYVSRELAELQGGQIKVESEFRHGSIFAFYIACRRAEDTNRLTAKSGSDIRIPVSALMTPQAEKISLAGYRVLLVEDNLVNQRVLSKQLEKLHCEVSVAGHGLEALAIIKRSRWYRGQEYTGQGLDVVLMDLEMPIMGGLECLRMIRAMEADRELVGRLPVIVVTANARRKQVEQAEDAGMDGFISKPFRIGELVPKILPFGHGSGTNTILNS